MSKRVVRSSQPKIRPHEETVYLSRGAGRLKSGLQPPRYFRTDSEARKLRTQPDTIAHMYVDVGRAYRAVKILQCFQTVLDDLGFKDISILEVRDGSVSTSMAGWFRSPKARAAAASAAKEVKDNAEQWVKAQTVQKATAEVDAMNADSISALLQATGDHNGIFVFHGFVVLKHVDDQGRSNVITRNLSPAEALVIEKYPGLLLEGVDTFFPRLAALVEQERPMLQENVPRALDP